MTTLQREFFREFMHSVAHMGLSTDAFEDAYLLIFPDNLLPQKYQEETFIAHMESLLEYLPDTKLENES